MAEKIPYEVLLPIAMELFSKVPQDKPVDRSDTEKNLEFRKHLIEDFSSFYHSLHQHLANPTQSTASDTPAD